MADITQEMTAYRIKQIEFAEAEYYEQLTKVLDKIEDDITSLAHKSLPTTGGKLIELRAAIAIRPQIKAILEREYLAWSDTVVRQGFNKQAKRVERSYQAILKKAKVKKKEIAVFSELTKGDLALIQNLKQQYFTQFKDISNTFTRTLGDKIYQNTLLGSEFTVLEKELRQTINGIYASSKDAEISKLVLKTKTGNKRINKLLAPYKDLKKIVPKTTQDQVKKIQLSISGSTQKLQSKFARDRVGNNMKRYAGQLLNDSLRDFDATLNFNKANDAGLTFVKYYGDVIPTTRTHCKRIVSGVYNRRKGGLFTIDEVTKLWNSTSWGGKKSGNPLVVRGGYNCRHQWSYVNPDWYDKQGELII